MLAVMLIVCGGLLMLFGVLMLGGWLSGKSNWFDAGVYDRAEAAKKDRKYLDLYFFYFFTIIVLPLLVGGLLIIFGLRRLG